MRLYMGGTTSKKKKQSFWHRVRLWSLATIILVVFAGVWALGQAGFRAFILPSASMEPTLIPGDRVLVRTFDARSRTDIRRGELIAFAAPVLNHPYYLKRVIGLPGDRLRIVKGSVYVNGQLLPEPYVRRDLAAADPFADNFPPVNRQVFDPAVLPQWKTELARDVNARGELVVPQNDYFVLGDNFDHSWDSRYWGFVARDAILGRPVLIYWSSSRAGVNWSRLFTIP